MRMESRVSKGDRCDTIRGQAGDERAEREDVDEVTDGAGKVPKVWVQLKL